MKDVLNIPITHDHIIHTNEAKDFNQVFVLLHGYLLDGEYMYERLQDLLPKDALILAPNGPFTVPVKKKEEYLAKYAWYFFDPHKQTFYIKYEPAADYIQEILSSYNPENKPVTLIGYSQGGYLSPKVAEIIPSVKKVIGLACVFRNTKFDYRQDVIYHQIHGSADVAVEYAGAVKEFEILKEKGNAGQFITLKDIGHKLKDEFFPPLKELL
jgi:predicted esterase